MIHRQDTGLFPFLPTAAPSYRARMASFEVTLKDHTVEYIDEADAYQQEGTMTTFFRNSEPRQVVDSWSHRVFSVRTTEVLMIRLVDEASTLPGARPLWAVHAAATS